jgi:hypothetical protein
MIESILNVLPLISFSIVLLYNGINIRNANKSRQAGLYMQLWNNFRNPQFFRSFNEIMYYYTWTDYVDYNQKYGVLNNIDTSTKISSIFLLFENIGGLVRQNLLDIKVIRDQAGDAYPPLWEKYYPVIVEDRKSFNSPRLWNDAEYLYNRLTRRE